MSVQSFCLHFHDQFWGSRRGFLLGLCRDARRFFVKNLTLIFSNFYLKQNIFQAVAERLSVAKLAILINAFETQVVKFTGNIFKINFKLFKLNLTYHGKSPCMYEHLSFLAQHSISQNLQSSIFLGCRTS